MSCIFVRFSALKGMTGLSCAPAFGLHQAWTEVERERGKQTNAESELTCRSVRKAIVLGAIPEGTPLSLRVRQRHSRLVVGLFDHNLDHPSSFI